MNTLLICDNCHEPFDIVPKAATAPMLPPIGGVTAAPQQPLDLEQNRVPLVLRRCGHTVCSVCTAQVLAAAHTHVKEVYLDKLER